MPFPVACACGQKFMAQDHLSGKRVPCPACSNELLIVPPAEAKPAAPKQATAASPTAKLAAKKPAERANPAAEAGLPPIAVRCACGKAYKAPGMMRGKSLKCPSCGQGIAIPQSPPNSASVPAAPDPFATGAALGGDLFGPDPFAGGGLGNGALGADLYSSPLAAGSPQGGPLGNGMAGIPTAAPTTPMQAAYGAPQCSDDGGGNGKLLIFLGVGVGVTLLGLVVGIWLVNRNSNDTVATTPTTPTTPAPSPTAAAATPPTTPAATAPAASTPAAAGAPAAPGTPSAAGTPAAGGAAPSADPAAGPGYAAGPMGPMGTPADPAANGAIVGTAPASATPGGGPMGAAGDPAAAAAGAPPMAGLAGPMGASPPGDPAAAGAGLPPMGVGAPMGVAGDPAAGGGLPPMGVGAPMGVGPPMGAGAPMRVGPPMGAGAPMGPMGPMRPGSPPRPGTAQSGTKAGLPADNAAASSPSGKALALGLSQWHPRGKLTGVIKAGDAEVLQAHYSWMTQILPFIGHQDVFDKIDFKKSRLDKENLQTGGILIPEFLNPADDRKRWKGYPFENHALTHFVGMSGIEDSRNVVAAKLPRSDPRAGVFGYDSIATPAEITDGTSNTIMVLGAGELANPWIMGGGATIRGARQPYFDKITGFGSKGTSGVTVVMADGSVRMISSNIDPAVFRALCTIHGSETVDLEKSAPFSLDK